MIPRELSAKLRDMTHRLPVVTLTGPRQSGKSTLLRNLFPDYRLVSLEDPDVRAYAIDDPRSFLEEYDWHVIFDEVQRAPELFSYIQGVVDERNEPGHYIMSGSQNFLLLKSISQSLAGRVAVLSLLPFSYHELADAGRIPDDIDTWLFSGGYPRLYDFDVSPADYYPSYTQTYLERDVHEELGVMRLDDFERFLGLCALRTGELVDISSLARDCGVATKTVRSWLSVLEASYIIYFLRPYHRNLGKRLIKTPKLYFHDTGLACSLLGIESAMDLRHSNMRGSLFENAVLSELTKEAYARGRKPELSFWRDSNGNEVDILTKRGGRVTSMTEVKSSATYNTRFFDVIDRVAPLLDVDPDRRFVVYTGEDAHRTSRGSVITLRDVPARICDAHNEGTPVSRNPLGPN